MSVHHMHLIDLVDELTSGLRLLMSMIDLVTSPRTMALRISTRSCIVSVGIFGVKFASAANFFAADS